jgi:signal peptidase II
MQLRRAVMCSAILILTFAVDQTSKDWAHGLPVEPGCTTAQMIAQHCGGIPQPVAGGVDMVLSYNSGAAFSNFQGGRILLSALASLALLAFGLMMYRSTPEQRMRRVALALIAGGTLGNLVDRLRDGAVTDFVFLHVRGHGWPIFNVADVALVVGVALLVLEGVLQRRKLRHGRMATI